ncbi:hypothetical protein HBN50_00980 [Halobacteriovorax sp. GB3]|uniref:putative metallopeptidase n=1 Tax=Halobacteriovorax sp. GB3 TaxID=2719615 RepID=UPI00235FDAA9|nr:putative metallopeptidase [Halobacteriovorax sp. GB3]MDD0851640.1 hypothetical protein [Halobacteriovorax sp. GB3]
MKNLLFILVFLSLQLSFAKEEQKTNSNEIPDWLTAYTEAKLNKKDKETKLESFTDFLKEHRGFNPEASLGNDGPNGGDSYGSEFASIGFELAKSLTKLENNIIDANAFLKATEEVVVYSDEGKYVKVNGQLVDALNFPKDKKILISRKRWREMTISQKIRLVFHEYLGIIDNERNVYKTSIKFNKFFDEQVSILKEKNIQPYYGSCQAKHALAYYGPACSNNTQEVKQAILCAKQEALQKCSLDSYKECTGQVVLKEGHVSAIGFSSCMVTSIVK